ncbi:RNA-directed DNA polymerase, eukaryota [Tanacetum coccineum]
MVSEPLSASLQTKLLRHSGIVASENTFHDALCVFNTKIETDILSNPSEIDAPKIMKKLTDIYFTCVTQTAKSTFYLSPRQMALWQSQMKDHTSDWLRVVSISGLGQTMNACSRVFAGDIYGDHVVSCAGIIGIKQRHNVVRDTLVDICYRSAISAGKEVDIGLDGGRDWQWRLATLPFAFGRLGVYCACDVLNYTFLASRLESTSLQTKLLLHSGIVASGPAFNDALCAFNTKMETVLLSNARISAGKEVEICLRGGCDKPLRPADMLLYSWDEGFDVCVDLIGSSPLTQTGMIDFVSGRAVIDATHRKRVKYEAKCTNIVYGFLPFSFSSLGELEKDEVTLLKRIRKFSVTQDIRARAVITLWQSQMEDHTSDWLRVPCSVCSKVFTGDIYGDHVVSCAGIIGIKYQHNVVRDTLVDISFRSGISAGKEVDICLRGGCDKPLRHTDMLLYSWDEGLDVCVDLIGSSPLTQTSMIDFVSGRAVIDATHHKRVKYKAKCTNIVYGFLPFSFSSLGELEKDEVTLLKRIRKFSVTQDIGARAVVHIFNRNNFAIAKGVGAQLEALNLNLIRISESESEAQMSESESNDIITTVIDARPDPETSPAKETHCHTSAKARNHQISFIKESEPMPNVPSYDDTIRQKSKKTFGSDFEPRPSATGYDNGIGLEGKKKFASDFEPRPSATGYENEIGLEGKNKFASDFELRLSATGYDNEIGLEGKRKFGSDFEPRPSATGYDNEIGLEGKKKFGSDFEPRPSATGYDNGIGLEVKNKFGSHFEPRPSATGYDNGGQEVKKRFGSDFELKPSATGYDNEIGL